MKMSTFSGRQLAQVNNADPFAAPVWRSPVHHTPGWVIGLVQLARLLIRRGHGSLIRHPLLDVAAATGVDLCEAGLARRRRPGPRHRRVAGDVAAGRPDWFARFVSRPGRDGGAGITAQVGRVMTIAGLAPMYRGRIICRCSARSPSIRYTDLVTVRLVSGQSAGRSPTGPRSWPTGSGRCCAGSAPASPGWLVLELVRRDALAAVIPALPIPAARICGRCRSAGARTARPWTIRLHGTHLLIAGATGAGKGSLLWGLVRAMLPPMRPGWSGCWRVIRS